MKVLTRSGRTRRRACSTFGRAVSAADYAALALSYPGVAKASAAWVTRDWTTLKALAHPYIQLVVATADQQPLAEQPTFAAKLRSFLDQRRDPNVSLRITDFIPVYIQLIASVEIDDAFPQQATIAKVQAALNPAVNPDGTIGFFAFERLSFGESHSPECGVRTASVCSRSERCADHNTAPARHRHRSNESARQHFHSPD